MNSPVMRNCCWPFPLYNNANYTSRLIFVNELLNEELTDSLKNYVLKYSVKNYVRVNKLRDMDRLLESCKSDVRLYNKLLKAEADELWSAKKRQLPIIFIRIFTKVLVMTF